MKAKSTILTMACAMLTTTWTACSQETIATAEDNKTPTDRVAFLIDDESADNSTKGAQATTAALSAGFGVSSAVYPATGSYATSPCGSFFYMIQAFPGVDTDYYWPEEDTKMAFYAYYPYGNSALTLQSAASSNGIPTYTFTVPQAVTAHIDMMTAQVVDRMASDHSAVPLTFAHRLTDIRFNITNRHPENTLTVQSITLCGMKYAGTLNNDTWTLTGSANSTSTHPLTFNANTDIAGGATVDITGTDYHFMVIPQTIDAGATLLIIKTTEYGTTRTYSYDLESSLTLLQGKSYTFNVSVGDGLLIVDPDTHIEDWSAQQTYISSGVTATGYDQTEQDITDGSVDINPWQQ